MGYKKEILSHHVGVRLTPKDGLKLNGVAAELHLEPSALVRKIILDYLHDFEQKDKA